MLLYEERLRFFSTEGGWGCSMGRGWGFFERCFFWERLLWDALPGEAAVKCSSGRGCWRGSWIYCNFLTNLLGRRFTNRLAEGDSLPINLLWKKFIGYLIIFYQTCWGDSLPIDLLGKKAKLPFSWSGDQKLYSDTRNFRTCFYECMLVMMQWFFFNNA
jgi:hypothetical protein